MPRWKLPIVAAVALATGLTPLSPLLAAPAALAPAATKAETGNEVVPVRDYRSHHRYYGGRHYGRRGGAVGLGIGLGIIGGIIAAEAYRPAPGYYYDDEDYNGPYYAPQGFSGDPRELCAQNFRSFEWRTGLYTTYSGEKKPCPYLQ